MNVSAEYFTRGPTMRSAGEVPAMIQRDAARLEAVFERVLWRRVSRCAAQDRTDG